jgi:hypothetical protein
MGEPNLARVDVGALLAIADQYDAVADAVDTVIRTQLTPLTFDGAVAGRVHVARGDAVRNAVEGVVDQLRAWSRASDEVASTLRASADRYAEADARFGRRLG